MSYCRWSCMDGMCDLYVYESVGGFWSVNVASNRTSLPWSQMAGDHSNWERNPIGLPADGETFDCATPGEAADKIEELMAMGYNCPPDVVTTLRAEQREINDVTESD